MTTAGGANSLSALPKWQLALAVGAPVALGLGYMYYRNCKKSVSKSDREKSEKTVENGTASDKQVSINGGKSARVLPTANTESETTLEKAQRYKNEGNKYFKSGKYDEAIVQYNKAIDTCPKENTVDLATFYQNRAACYEQLKKFSAVKADCTKALELNPRYIKALQRRARALEHNKELESVLEDITTACMLERFSNQSTLIMADRILKQLGRQHAQEHMASKKPVMPSKYFIKTYFSSFSKDPIFSTLDELRIGDVPTSFEKAKQALKEEKYDDIIPLCSEELNRLSSEDTPYKMEVLLLRATFYILLGQHEEAIEDLNKIVNSPCSNAEMKVNALIKRASMYMQLEDPIKCFTDFDAAMKLDPDCSDVYHHRGQVNLLMEKLDEAKADFKKAVELNPNCGIAYVQKCYTDYRYAIENKNSDMATSAMTEFKKAFETFPNCSECYTLYAQMLCNSNEYEKADTYFAKAIEKDLNNATIYVHRGLLHLQWNGNVEKAIQYINEALKMDDKCEFGYETLGTIEVQRGNLNEAIALFEKAIALCRTVMELTHIFTLRDAAKMQLTVTERLGPDMTWIMQGVP